jgi:O-antigen/teichoic acid export membrane protein
MRHLVIFTLANGTSLACNGLLTFLLPRWLSMENYGCFRLFVLYGGFTGLLHLGLLDGALLRWASAPRRRLRREAWPGLVFLLTQHFALLTPLLLVLPVCVHTRALFAFVPTALYAVAWNAAVLGQFGLQAERSFVLLSAATLVHPALLLGMVCELKRENRLTLGLLFAAYLGAMFAAAIVVWVVLLRRYPATRFLRGKSRVAQAWRVGWRNIVAGWGVLLAAGLTNLALSLDRLAVSLSFPLRDFAIYSLAATAMAVVNSMILSTSRVLFPYLAQGVGQERQRQVYGWGESCLMAVWAISLAAYFPLRRLIEEVLPGYAPSLPILRLLMLATGMTGIIYILHNNYFRSHRRLGGLLFGAGVGLLTATLLLAVARRSGSLGNMAWAMLAAITVWWAAEEYMLQDLAGRSLHDIGKTLLFMAACGGCFFGCASMQREGVGLAVYGAAALGLTTFTYGQTLQALPRPAWLGCLRRRKAQPPGQVLSLR